MATSLNPEAGGLAAIAGQGQASESRAGRIAGRVMKNKTAPGSQGSHADT
ncbi:MAG: hypothetical protein R6U27_11405 [Desulfobacterales bacterium]